MLCFLWVVKVEIGWFLKGVVLGFSIAAPVGPIGILCIRRTLEHGRFSGLFSGLGAAVADSVYAIIAAFGLTIVSNFLVAGQYWLRLIGGGFLLYLGWKTCFAKPSDMGREVSHKGLLSDFVSTFFLTMTNPLTILSFLAIFAGIGLSSVRDGYSDASLLVGGVFLGSALWWVLLSEGVTLFRKRVSVKVMRWINRIAGLIIIAFGIAVLSILLI